VSVEEERNAELTYGRNAMGKDGGVRGRGDVGRGSEEGSKGQREGRGEGKGGKK
jgi:hypothetical protein